MKNRDNSIAWNYHDATKHSYWSVRSSGHGLDWDNRPFPFKVYPDLEPIPLPQSTEPLSHEALSAISSVIAPTAGQPLPDLSALARILYLSAGITRRRTHSGGEFFFRAASHTGAMYAIELYLVCCDLPGLEAGVYHFGPGDFALRKLRSGDLRGVLVRATAAEPAMVLSPAIIVSTGTYWRNAWKYQARTYRHFGWDGGTLLANLLAAATAVGLSARVVLGFVDAPVNGLLGLDTSREVALSLVPLGYQEGLPTDHVPTVEPLTHATLAYSKSEVDYPLLREMHEASSLISEPEAQDWRSGPNTIRPLKPAADFVPLSPIPDAAPSDSIDRVIIRRGSTRQFARKAIALNQLSSILYHATQGIPADFLDPPGNLLNDLYLIVHAVEDLSAGAYVLHRDSWVLEQLEAGQFRREAGHLGLDQELPADASATVFFLANLNPILERFGNRGYRAVQLEAGIIGGKMYLAAYALGIGATGLTFYDDEVTEFFSPHAAGKSAIFLMAFGRPAGK